MNSQNSIEIAVNPAFSTVESDVESFHGIAASQRLTQTTRNWATEMAWNYIGQTFRAIWASCQSITATISPLANVTSEAALMPPQIRAAQLLKSLQKRSLH
ncbi:MAG: hypothetical protein O2862_07310 [Bacteroidetes bacterium]|nr:hypothetical protein [Bacteroidota bacterium]